MKQGIAKKNHELVFLYDKNLVDEVWNESRPKPPNKPVRVHDLKYAGVDVASKLLSLRSELADAGSSAIIISMLDEVAWLLNLVIPLNISVRFFWQRHANPGCQLLSELPNEASNYDLNLSINSCFCV